LFTFLTIKSEAQTCTATKSGNWNAGPGSGRAEWSCNGGATSPNNASEVVIPSGITVTINNNQTWTNASVIVEDGGTIVFDNQLNLSCGKTLIIEDGGLIIDGGGGSNDRLIICGNTIITSQPSPSPPAVSWPPGGFTDTGFDEDGEISNLPVTLIYFKARPNDSQITLSWKTGTELNNDYFTLERSRDGFHYQKVGTVQGYGTTNQPQLYEFIDEQPFSGTSYYRLSQTDYDGTTEVFRPISVNYEGKEFGFYVFPNPTTETLYVSTYNFKAHSSVTVNISDFLGRSVFYRQLTTNEFGSIDEDLDIQNLPAGTYLVQLSSEGLFWNFKIIKE